MLGISRRRRPHRVEPDGRCPVGLLGRAYWYGVYPLHKLVFNGMLDGIAKRAKHGEGIRPAGVNDTAA